MQPKPEPPVLHRPISSGSVSTEASSHPQLSLKSFPKASLPRALPKACQSKITHPTATTNRKRTSYFGKEFLPEAGITVVPGSQHGPFPLPLPSHACQGTQSPELSSGEPPAAGEKPNTEQESKVHNFQLELSICSSAETTISLFPTTWGTKLQLKQHLVINQVPRF